MSAIRRGLVSLFIALSCVAQQLVKDINVTVVGANPGSSPTSGVWLPTSSPGFFFFSADDARHGQELWRTDGTPAGTSLVVDLRPGALGAAPQDLTVFNGLVYFTADDGAHGRELWLTDGTVAGTVLVADIVPGVQGADPAWLRAANTLLYFSAASPAFGRELWSTSATGTSLVADVNPGTGSGFVSGLVVQQTGTNQALFISDDGIHGREPALTMGSSATVLDLQSSAGSDPRELVALGADFYFVATTSMYGVQVWRLDMLAQKAYPATSLTQGPGTRVYNLRAANTHVYFAHYPQFGSVSVYRCNAAGAIMLGTYAAFQGADAYMFNEFAGYFYYGVTLFSPLPVNDAYAVQVTTGAVTKANKCPISVILQAPGGAPLFIAPSSIAGYYSLWTINRAIATEIKQLTTIVTIPKLIGNNKTQTFVAVDDTVVGTELWITDATAVGTKALKDIALPPTASSAPAVLTSLRGIAYFVADDGTHGAELWRSDGTDAGTFLVKDINSNGSSGSNPNYLFVFKDALYFSASDGTTGLELWRSDGTTAGTTLVKDINAGANSSQPRSFVEFQGMLLFAADDGPHGRELWQSDGTTAGTKLFYDIAPGAWPGAGGASFNLVSTGTAAYFVGYDGFSGEEPWVTDGTATHLIRDLYVGPGSSVRDELVLNGSVVYFAARDNSQGYELWRSDGTLAGTYMVKAINPNSGDANPRNLIAGYYQGVFFTADEVSTGSELWRSDGTPVGTYRVADVAPGAASSMAKPLACMLSNQRESIFFATSMPTPQLWLSIPASSSTTLLRDVSTGLGVQVGLGRLIAFGGRDAANGDELWISDGSVAGTYLVADLEVGAANSSPRWLTSIGEKLVFAATITGSGRELYSIPLRRLGAALFDPFGVGCGNTSSRVPVLSLGGQPSYREGGYALSIANARASAAGALFYAEQTIDTPLGFGCHLYVPLGAPAFPFTTTSGGFTAFPVTIPSLPWIVGHQSYWQAAVLDPTGLFLNLVTISNAGRVTVGK